MTGEFTVSFSCWNLLKAFWYQKHGAIPLGWEKRRDDQEFLLKNFWPRTSQQATAAKTISSDLPSLGLGTDSSACSFTDEGMTQSPVSVDKDRSGVIALLGCFPTFEDNLGGQSISVILGNGFWTLGIQAWLTWLENRTTKSQICNFSELLYIWKTIIPIYDVLQILNC